MRFIHIFLNAALLITVSLNATADTAQDDVRIWLQRMVNAVHSLNYDGTFVFLHNAQLESMQIVHTVDNGGERERLTSLNGVAREVFRDNASVTCIAPDIKSVSIGNRVSGRGFRAVFSVDINQLSDYYNFHMLGEERVAGRQAKVVAIIPQDAYRYGYRLYLDTEHALPLKTDMLNVSGVSISQLMFTQLQVHSSSREIAEISLDGKEYYQWVQQKPMRTISDRQFSGWSFSDLPKGFDVTLHSKRKAGKQARGIDHFVLSDGLASLSVYVEDDDDVGLQGNSTMCTVNAYGNTISGYQVTAVGEVPAMTVERIAKSLRFSK
ncbi:MucB/RseB C-terminal domain-containing protein [Sedimenticola selenatireducens]|uniref:Transcriptional regulator n=1 Tax=Sedimenticola selenatireducens TaxID=191960 RepID=A0A2N6CZZ9_9GAMM|nr:MucB/RseB C-terminal domain-containing protein [Sedimenticola selenatireducens]PLX62991.1 MAG: transcriptional regulator [Sedimenticola selenatireducens]